MSISVHSKAVLSRTKFWHAVVVDYTKGVVYVRPVLYGKAVKDVEVRQRFQAMLERQAKGCNRRLQLIDIYDVEEAAWQMHSKAVQLLNAKQLRRKS